MGASLEYHKGATLNRMPAVYAMEIFRKFGFEFDHIYAFEMKPILPDKVYQKLPDHFMKAYHWINLPVSADPDSMFNPLKLVLDNFNEDDMVVIKLDIDTPFIEMPLAYQLLESSQLASLVDHFYFEHHVNLREISHDWKDSMTDSVAMSLRLFHSLREKGVAAHYWP
jgi:hypothetical protein